MKEPQKKYIKELIVNGVLLAKYLIESEDWIFIKIIKSTSIEYENCLVNLIGHVENKRFKMISYLNI